MRTSARERVPRRCSNVELVKADLLRVNARCHNRASFRTGCAAMRRSDRRGIARKRPARNACCLARDCLRDQQRGCAGLRQGDSRVDSSPLPARRSREGDLTVGRMPAPRRTRQPFHEDDQSTAPEIAGASRDTTQAVRAASSAGRMPPRAQPPFVIRRLADRRRFVPCTPSKPRSGIFTPKAR